MNILSTLSIALFGLISFHPLHVTITEIEMDEKDKALEITMRLFIDDMEVVLQQNLNQPGLDILNPTNATTDQLLKNYIKDRFAISLDNKPQTIIYLGHQIEDDAFIVYVEVAKVKKWKTIQVKNLLLMEAFDDQSNLVNVTFQRKVRSLRLTQSKPADKLSFDLNN